MKRLCRQNMASLSSMRLEMGMIPLLKWVFLIAAMKACPSPTSASRVPSINDLQQLSHGTNEGTEKEVHLGRTADFTLRPGRGQRGANVFDVSRKGSSTWDTHIAQYDRRLEQVESSMVRLLTSRLSQAGSTENLFVLFSAFRSLFFRPAIYNAVMPFRSVLVKSVHDDMKVLREKLTGRYDEGPEGALATLRDLPPLAGRILWAQQIENQLHVLMGRIESVLGVNWKDHDEGKHFSEVCRELLGRLGVGKLYNDWLTSCMKSDTLKYTNTRDFLFLVEDDGHHKRSCSVNFDPRRVTIFKEVKYLDWLLPSLDTIHKSIPLTIRSVAEEVRYRYPIAMSLEASLAVMVESMQEINSRNNLLLASHVAAARRSNR